MTKQFIKDALGWGLGMWLFGYILGFVFFALVPPAYIGWVIMPFGIGLTLWVLCRKVVVGTMSRYLRIAVVWTILAVVLDYFLLVKLLKPVDGYYKLDVYLYYIITFILPLLVGMKKQHEGKD